MSNAKTIKILNIASGDLWAGAEVQLFTLVTTLNKRQDVSVEVVLLNHGTLEQKLIENNISVTVIDESRLNGFQILRQLVATISESKPDIVHTHRIKENTLGSIAALFSSTPTVRTSHGAPEHKPAWHSAAKRLILFTDWFCGRFLQKKIIAVSDDLSKILRQDFPAEKIEVIENGIDLPTPDSSASKKNTHVENQNYRIGIAGRLVPIKRVDLFIKTAAALSKTYPELHCSFHIFGEGPLHSELTALSKKLRTNKIVYFEGHCDNMRKQLASLDALLITSDHEGLPMILLEAMSHKIPVISHAVGGIPATLDQGKCGILVSEQQAESYADAIYQLMNNSETRNDYINKAFNRVSSVYSSTNNADKYYLLYKQLL